MIKKISKTPKDILLTLTTASFGVFFAFIGCGFLDNNSQPTIETITDQTLYVDDKITVDVNITDEDIDDTHIISVSSDNMTIATASISNTTLIVVGISAGLATITVSVTDDSNQDDAAAIPVTFQVTVNELIDRGACLVGMTLRSGESCRYSKDPFEAADIVFSVLQDGSSCRKRKNLKSCVESDIEQDDFFGTNFAARKNPDGSWTIESVPWFYIRQMLGSLNSLIK
ncbi:MAG: hypothetical protein OXU36_06625 [Candidatus Poribacteria bacterium]|nr:hypothetical protein [Candidatus Poribacteria bacterium]